MMIGEFTGLDLEMAIHGHYNEVLHVTHNMFKHIFNGLEQRYVDGGSLNWPSSFDW